MSLSTHVLNAGTGRPVEGMEVSLQRRSNAGWESLQRRVTDSDGRVADLATILEAGVYRLVFDVEKAMNTEVFYPEVAIAFRVGDPAQHYHVPLLLSPFAYSTYRGS